jgi:hypothetical protein
LNVAILTFRAASESNDIQRLQNAKNNKPNQ